MFTLLGLIFCCSKSIFACCSAVSMEQDCKEYAIQHGFDGYYNRKGDYVKF